MRPTITDSEEKSVSLRPRMEILYGVVGEGMGHATRSAVVLELFILVAAFIFAKLEIEIEGPHGWAEKLPTWRVERHTLLDWFFGGRPLTGYHVWAFALILFCFHMPFFWLAGSWSLRGELQVLAAYTAFWIIEDALWFVLNPHYGWRKFTRSNVWWHKRWLFGLPLDYWLMTVIVAALLSLRQLV